MDDFRVEQDGRLAGLHRVSDFFVDTNFVGGNRHALFHEALHERLIMDTLDGQLLKWLKQLSTHGVTDEISTHAERWFQAMFRSAGVAHESLATYLAIEQLPKEDRLHTTSSLTSAYQQLRQRVATEIEAIEMCSFVHFALAWVIGEGAFASPFARRFVELNLEDEAVLTDDEKPDWRLERLLDGLGKRLPTLRTRLVELGAKLGRGIQRESEWEKLSSQQSRALDSHILDEIRRWASTESFGIDMTEATRYWNRESRQPLLDKVIGYGLLGGQVAHAAPTALLRASRHSNSLLINRQRKTLFDSARRTQDVSHVAQFTGALRIFTLERHGDFMTREWIVAMTEGGQTYSAIAPMAAVNGLARARAWRSHCGRPVPSVALLLVGVEALSDTTAYLEALSVFGDRDGPPQNMHWYLAGDYADAVKALHESFGGALDFEWSVVHSALAQVEGGLQIGGPAVDLVLHWIKARVAGMDMSFLRILNPISSSYVTEYELELARTTTLRIARPVSSDMERFAEVVALISDTWREF